MWDGIGNVWERMDNPYAPGYNEMALRGGAWRSDHWNDRVSFRLPTHPDFFGADFGVRVVVGPVFPPSGS